MVGAKPAISPDGRLLILDGSDACSASGYDHAGCSKVPSHVYHLLQTADRQIVRAFPFSVATSGTPHFADRSRFLVFGTSITVIDVNTTAVLEEWKHPTEFYRQAIFAPEALRLFLGGPDTHDVLVLQLEDPVCAASQVGLIGSYTGDGTLDDAANVTTLTEHGRVDFVPGKVGQAFFFDGTGGYLVGPRTAHYTFGVQDSALALYVKFTSLHGEMALLERMTTDKAQGIALIKSDDNRLVLRFATTTGLMTAASTTQVVGGRWYQVAITKNERKLALYVNGELEGERALSGRPAIPSAGDVRTPLHVGAGLTGKTPLYGWLDEIGFYNRSLNAAEVKALYQMRESGPCKADGAPVR